MVCRIVGKGFLVPPHGIGEQVTDKLAPGRGECPPDTAAERSRFDHAQREKIRSEFGFVGRVSVSENSSRACCVSSQPAPLASGCNSPKFHELGLYSIGHNARPFLSHAESRALHRQTRRPPLTARQHVQALSTFSYVVKVQSLGPRGAISIQRFLGSKVDLPSRIFANVFSISSTPPSPMAYSTPMNRMTRAAGPSKPQVQLTNLHPTKLTSVIPE